MQLTSIIKKIYWKFSFLMVESFKATHLGKDKVYEALQLFVKCGVRIRFWGY